VREGQVCRRQYKQRREIYFGPSLLLSLVVDFRDAFLIPATLNPSQVTFGLQESKCLRACAEIRICLVGPFSYRGVAARSFLPCALYKLATLSAKLPAQGQRVGSCKKRRLCWQKVRSRWHVGVCVCLSLGFQLLLFVPFTPRNSSEQNSVRSLRPGPQDLTPSEQGISMVDGTCFRVASEDDP
jgi:hypothetical protein